MGRFDDFRRTEEDRELLEEYMIIGYLWHDANEAEKEADRVALNNNDSDNQEAPVYTSSAPKEKIILSPQEKVIVNNIRTRMKMEKKSSTGLFRKK